MECNIMTYNDLQKCTNEHDKIEFIKSAIHLHETSEAYKNGVISGQYYRHGDPDLDKIEKFVLDKFGEKHKNDVSPNHKLKTNLYHFFITQLVMHLLGNGVTFKNQKIKDALGGAAFDYRLQEVFTYAINDGEAYALVTDKGITPLCIACKINGNEPVFVPLKDEYTGETMAGLRYWRLSPNKPLAVTLYEPDGFSEYRGADSSTLELYKPKASYKGKILSNKIEGQYASGGNNYNGFPIVRMGYINNQSEIVGNRSKLFAYNVVQSGMVNKVDLNTIYWIIENYDDMDAIDDLRLVADMMNGRIIHQKSDTGVKKEEFSTHPNDNISVLEELRRQLFMDFQAVDVTSMASGNKTTVEIKSAYHNLDRKCDEVERFVSDFIRECLRVKGLDEKEEFHFSRPKEINEAEYIRGVISSAPYLDDEMPTKLICEALGIADEITTIIDNRKAQELSRFGLVESEESGIKNEELRIKNLEGNNERSISKQ